MSIYNKHVLKMIKTKFDNTWSLTKNNNYRNSPYFKFCSVPMLLYKLNVLFVVVKKITLLSLLIVILLAYLKIKKCRWKYHTEINEETTIRAKHPLEKIIFIIIIMFIKATWNKPLGKDLNRFTIYLFFAQDYDTIQTSINKYMFKQKLGENHGKINNDQKLK